MDVVVNEDHEPDNDLDDACSGSFYTADSGMTSSDGSLEDPGDISLRAYARSHRLCTDYKNDAHLPHACQQNIIREEKLGLDKRSAVFLHKVMETIDYDCCDMWPAPRARKRFRAESPVLMTDNQLDLKLFNATKKSIKDCDAPACSAILDDDYVNQAVEWLDLSIVTKATARTSSEKLQVLPNEASFLQFAHGATFASKDEQSQITQELDSTRTLKPKHETPPLLPQSSPFSPACPASPIGLLTLASSPLDPTKIELDEVERLILVDDTLGPSKITTKTPEDGALDMEIDDKQHSPSQSFLHADLPSSSPVKRQRLEDLKEEIPLASSMDVPSPEKKLKTVAFSNTLATIIPEHVRAFPTAPADFMDEDTPGCLEKILNLAAQAAMIEVDHEQLSEADSLLRVEIPLIDHSMPKLPWETLVPCNGSRDGSRNSTLHYDPQQEEKSWQSRSKIDTAVVIWEPFPARLGMVVTEERIDEDALEQYFNMLSFKEIEIEEWKPEGFRILDANETDDDELDSGGLLQAQISEPFLEDIHSLVKRRQQEIETVDRKGDHIGSGEAAAINIANYDNETSEHIMATAQPKASKLQSSLGDAFSPTATLERFIQTQTGTVTTVVPISPQTATCGVEFTRENPASPLTHEQVMVPRVESVIFSLPTPGIGMGMPAQTPRQFILSSSLLTRPTLVRRIEHLYTEAQFIDREFDAGNGSPRNVNMLGKGEPDMLLSPATGLVVTSLQQIKQKPLPGQRYHAGIHERIVSIVDRYEQLIVLVSEGQSSSLSTVDGGAIRELGERDAMSLNSLTHFTTRLEADIRILYVPGGEENLASWTVSCMVRYGVDPTAIPLVSEETLWELCLRKAGLNAFAAQAVLVAVREPPPPILDSDSTVSTTTTTREGSGLGALVQLGTQARHHHFASLLGGSRVLGKVSGVIGRAWNSLEALHPNRER